MKSKMEVQHAAPLAKGEGDKQALSGMPNATGDVPKDIAASNSDQSGQEVNNVITLNGELGNGLCFKFLTTSVCLLYLIVIASIAIFAWFILPKYLPHSFSDFWNSHWVWEGLASLFRAYFRDVFLVGVFVAFMYLIFFWIRNHFELRPEGWMVKDGCLASSKNPFKGGIYFLRDAYDILTPPVRRSIKGRIGALFTEIFRLHKKIVRQNMRHGNDIRELRQYINNELIKLNQQLKEIQKQIQKEKSVSDPKLEKWEWGLSRRWPFIRRPVLASTNNDE